MCEWLFAGKIKYDNGSLAPFEKRFDNWSVFLLASCVPNMKFYDLALNLKRLQSEINSCDRWLCLSFSIFIGKGHEKWSFTHTAVSNQNYLKFCFVWFCAKRLFSAAHLKTCLTSFHVDFFIILLSQKFEYFKANT